MSLGPSGDPQSPVRTRVSSPSGGPALAAFVLGLPAALALVATTQALAYRAQFHPALGEPLVALPADLAGAAGAGAAVLAVGAVASLWGKARWGWAPFGVLVGLAVPLALLAVGPLYPVDAGARWAWRAVQAGGPDGNFVFLVAGLCFFGGLVVASSIAGSAKVRAAGTHGTASWGNGGSLRSKDGLLLGRHRGTDLRYSGPGHLLTVAPTRAGKGVGAVVPALLEAEDSVLVTDPKGENFALTAAYRRDVIGQRVVALDPFDLADRLDLPTDLRRSALGAYNPLDLVDPASPDAVDDAAMIADMLVVPEPGSPGSFWDDEAKALLAGLVLHVASVAPDRSSRTLLTVRALLTLSPTKFKELMAAMANSLHPAVQRAANRLQQKEDRERSGVVSSAQRHTHFLDSARMEHVLGGSASGDAHAGPALTLADLGRGPFTLYLVLPPDRLDTFSRWLRLVIACAVAELARTPPVRGRRVLFLLDEFANLGPMAPVKRAVSLLAGYGIRVWTFLQDLTQLKGLYPRDWETFVANADVIQAFSVTDQTTAEYLSKMTGRTTVFGQSQSAGKSRGKHYSRSAGSSASEQGRDLVTPDELRRLGPDEQLLLARGEDPVIAAKVQYYADRRLKRRASDVPAALSRSAA
ncbi:type IV secretory system conjugative DNA transfer family protein [Rubrivirga litoralis]|uniref:Type IV secretory system conjugative DNA transfer family protein n=1 Tax=Rubrivirga litoralis TaxID=3075598 RepID=A0ABU3BUG9_9BACT|nr:type IV secretory system conjugative DNA transfer family protein [Rubrivirga sp. F394]MDT0632943.1 type IV secretory system conjugative DNA transfer family protein [Rubrivirga sp. F394]